MDKEWDLRDTGSHHIIIEGIIFFCFFFICSIHLTDFERTYCQHRANGLTRPRFKRLSRNVIYGNTGSTRTSMRVVSKTAPPDE